MDYVKLGNSDLLVSRICLGCMGFGGVLKNQSIGVASSSGKLYIHSAGRSTNRWMSDDKDGFLESMAAAAQG